MFNRCLRNRHSSNRPSCDFCLRLSIKTGFKLHDCYKWEQWAVKLTILKPTDKCLICVNITMLDLKQDIIALTTKISIIANKTNISVWSFEEIFCTLRYKSTSPLIRQSIKFDYWMQLTDTLMTSELPEPSSATVNPTAWQYHHITFHKSILVST